MKQLERSPKRSPKKVFLVTKFVLANKPRILRRDEARYLLRRGID